MKNIILSVSFSFFAMSIFSQEFNFTFLTYTYIDATNKNLKLENLVKTGPVGKTYNDGGFNSYEINIPEKTVIHKYLNSDGTKLLQTKSSIYNLITTNGYIKFDTKSPVFGELNILVNKDSNIKYNLLVKYKSGTDTEILFN